MATKSKKPKSNKTVTDKIEELNNDHSEQSLSDDVVGSQPTTVEAAYWEQKVKEKTISSSTNSGLAKGVEEYTSNIMVVARPDETSEQLLRRFNREVRDLNLMDEIRERLEYEKPSQRRKRERRERLVNIKRHRYE